MGKAYDKPAIIDSKTIEPEPDGCQQGHEAGPLEGRSPATSNRSGRDRARRHITMVRDDK